MYHATYDSGTETPLAPDTTARSTIYIVVCVSSMTLRPAISRIDNELRYCKVLYQYVVREYGFIEL